MVGLLLVELVIWTFCALLLIVAEQPITGSATLSGQKWFVLGAGLHDVVLSEAVSLGCEDLCCFVISQDYPVQNLGVFDLCEILCFLLAGVSALVEELVLLAL